MYVRVDTASWPAALPEVEHEPWIMNDKAPEPRRA